jgi:hypothetical protein
MHEKKLNREEIITKLAHTYIEFLKSIKWDSELYLKGIHEGKNKFLSNTYLHICGDKYGISNYHSKEALFLLNNKTNASKSGKLVFEHMVPKTKYIQGPCEDLAKAGKLTFNEIFPLLEKYWFIATITKEEEKLLKTSKVMPLDWDNKNHFARYENTNIELIPNPIWLMS